MASTLNVLPIPGYTFLINMKKTKEQRSPENLKKPQTAKVFPQNRS